MEAKKEFLRMINECEEIALATSIHDFPNVRIVNYYYDEKNNPKLEGALLDKTLTKSQMGYMIAKENQHLLNTVNFILSELELRGEIEKLQKEYLK